MGFYSVDELLKAAKKDGISLYETILKDDCAKQNISEHASFSKMQSMWESMQKTLVEYDERERSASGLAGGDGAKAKRFADDSISGVFLSAIISNALKMGECNACMKRIVAAPTAGSCGVIPAVLLAYKDKFKTSDDDIVKALYVSAGFGQIIANRACLSGAEGGCQAEIGSASAMAASALVYLHGGNADMCANAVAIALKNLMGLICDPVAGLVEVPCIKRNAIGAVNAVICADMAMAGIESRVPTDEVIDAMGEVGRAMPKEFKETAKGGLAATAFAVKTAEILNTL